MEISLISKPPGRYKYIYVYTRLHEWQPGKSLTKVKSRKCSPEETTRLPIVWQAFSRCADDILMAVNAYCYYFVYRAHIPISMSRIYMQCSSSSSTITNTITAIAASNTSNNWNEMRCWCDTLMTIIMEARADTNRVGMWAQKKKHWKWCNEYFFCS